MARVVSDGKKFPRRRHHPWPWLLRRSELQKAAGAKHSLGGEALERVIHRGSKQTSRTTSLFSCSAAVPEYFSIRYMTNPISNGDIPAVPSGVKVTTLDNGLTIIVREDHSAPVVSAQAWAMAGSI